MTVPRNIVANYLGAAWNALMTLAFVPVYIRLLGIGSYGLIGIYALLQAWLSLLDLGLTPALGRAMARIDADADGAPPPRVLLRSAEVVAGAVALALTAAFAAGAPALATHWLSSRGVPPATVARAVAIMGAVIGLRFVENVYRSTLNGLQCQVRLNAVTSCVATLRGLGVIGILAWVSPTIEAYFLWQCAVSLLGTAAMGVVAHRALPGAPEPARFSLDALRSIARFAAGSFLIALLSLVLTQVDKLLLSRLLALEDFGYYAFAVVVAQAPLALVGPVTQAYYPRFAQLVRIDEEALAKAYHAACQIVAVMLGAAAVLLVAFGRELLLAWTGDPALAAREATLVAVIAAGTLANGLMTTPYFLQLASGWTGLAIRVNTVAIAIVVPALFWIVPRYGPLGAAWTWLALNLASASVIVPAMHRRLLPAERGRWLATDVGVPLAAAALVALALRALLPETGDRAMALVQAVACGVAVGCAAVLAAPVPRAALMARLRGSAA